LQKKLNFNYKNIVIVPVIIFLITSCTTKKVTWAPEDEVISATYQNNKPTSITLLTMINNTTGMGGHSALLINSEERILFDPAGTFKHPQIPEQHDVFFGMNDTALERYIDYHARPTIHVVMQSTEIESKVAIKLTNLVKNYGPVQDMMCSYAITEVLNQVPNFITIPKSYFPKTTMENFSKLEGVTTTKVFDYFLDDKSNIFFEKQKLRK
jgi:hypothetical protein